MTKNRSRSLFVLFSIVLVICLIATFLSFTYPFAVNGKYYSYSSFVSNIKMGEDISTSLRVVYRAETIDEFEMTSNYEVLRSSTVNDLQSILQDEGFKDSTVSTYGEDCILVTVGDLQSKQDSALALSLLDNPAKISFSMSSNASEAFADATDVEDVYVQDYAQTSGTSWYVVIKFKSESLPKVEEATKDGGSLYILFGEDDSSPISITLDSAITDGIVSFTGAKPGDLPWSQADAKSYANRLKTGLLSLKLTKLSSSETEGSYGSVTHSGDKVLFGGVSAVLIWAVLGLVVLAAFVFLIVKYKQLGWLACFNLLFFICIGLFLLQSIPLVHMNFAGMVGMALCFMLAVDSLISIFESAKRYYNADAKLHIAFKTAQKDSLIKTFILSGLVAVVGLVCVFIPIPSIQSFGWAALVLPIVSLFTSLVLMRLFIKMYLALNNFDGKKCNFHKGGKNVSK